MATSTISTPAAITNSAGRPGVCLYDNPTITDNYHKSAYVIYNDGTWRQEKRGDLTVLSGNAWNQGGGPGGNGGIGPGF